MCQEELGWNLVPFEVSAINMDLGVEILVLVPVPKETAEVEEPEEGA